MESAIAQPMTADTSSPSALGDADRIVSSAAVNGVDQEEDSIREKTVTKLEEILQTKIGGQMAELEQK